MSEGDGSVNKVRAEVGLDDSRRGVSQRGVPVAVTTLLLVMERCELVER